MKQNEEMVGIFLFLVFPWKYDTAPSKKNAVKAQNRPNKVVDCSFDLDPDKEKIKTPIVKKTPKIRSFDVILFSLDFTRKLKKRTPKNLDDLRTIWRI